MVEAHLFINGTDIGCLRCRNLGSQNKKGETWYDVLYVHPVHVFQFDIAHRRSLGVEALYGKAFTILAAKKRRFFSISKKLIQCEDGLELVRVCDIPVRYGAHFFVWMNGQTASSTKDGKMAVFLSDLERWLQTQMNGTALAFD